MIGTGIPPLSEKDVMRAVGGSDKVDSSMSVAFRVAAHSSPVLGILARLNAVNGDLMLPLRIQKAISLRARRLNGCFDTGLAPEDAALGCDDLLGFQRGLSDDPREQAMLALTTKIVRDRGKHTACVVDAARELGITDREIVETVFLVAQHTLLSYLHGISAVESEQDNFHQSVKEVS